MKMKRIDFLPISPGDLKLRGWDEPDVILISGDAYVDHSSYGAAVIGRVLESEGYRVGIIAQPDWRGIEDFIVLGRPRLFFGITSGNVDSLVANYTANRRPRTEDDYSPGGKAGLRPDRAAVVYANRVKEAFGDVPIVLGGIEASLRRLAHYDYWDNCVRRCLLLDSRGDILVYGMGESQILEIARRLRNGEEVSSLNHIRGTVVVRRDCGFLPDQVVIPSFEEVKEKKERFNQAFKIICSQQNPFTARPVVQKHQDRFVIQFPPALPLSAPELDRIYELPYARGWHPVYEKSGGVKGFEAVRHSLISHRGCCGECSFCSLFFHQGRIVQSRSPGSILKEAKLISRRPDFRGTITDVGGPAANLYQARCPRWEKEGFCEKRSCLFPAKCENLVLGYEESLKLYRRIKELPGIKHVFIASGFRYDLLNEDFADEYLEEVCRRHISGQMKVAPEHSVDEVLRIMGKPPLREYEEFIRRFDGINRRLGKKLYLVNYFISSHPGAALKDALKLARYLQERRLSPEQVQDFLPLPMTLAAGIYHTGVHPLTGEEVYVARTFRERKMQRALLQIRNPANRRLVLKALDELKASPAERKVFSRCWQTGKGRRFDHANK